VSWKNESVGAELVEELARGVVDRVSQKNESVVSELVLELVRTAVDVAESKEASSLTSSGSSELSQLATSGPEVVTLREVPAAQGRQRRGAAMFPRGQMVAARRPMPQPFFQVSPNRWCRLCGLPMTSVYGLDHPACLYDLFPNQLRALGYRDVQLRALGHQGYLAHYRGGYPR
jgi:hypothetical protein